MNVLKVGVSYIIPPKEKSKNHKFWELLLTSLCLVRNLANVKVTSNRLAGACFYVVSGHGGPDPGAIGKSG